MYCVDFLLFSLRICGSISFDIQLQETNDDRCNTCTKESRSTISATGFSLKEESMSNIQSLLTNVKTEDVQTLQLVTVAAWLKGYSNGLHTDNNLEKFRLNLAADLLIKSYLDKTNGSSLDLDFFNDLLEKE